MQGMIYEVEFSLYIDCRLKVSRNRVVTVTVVSGYTIINATKCELENDIPTSLLEIDSDARVQYYGIACICNGTWRN